MQDSWDGLAATLEDVPVEEWQKKELERRKVNLIENSASGLDWEDVKRGILNRDGR